MHGRGPLPLHARTTGLNLEVNRAGPALQRKKPLRFAVGVNSAVDLIVSGTALMAALEVAPPSNVLHETLTSLQDLGETFAYSFSSGESICLHRDCYCCRPSLFFSLSLSVCLSLARALSLLHDHIGTRARASIIATMRLWQPMRACILHILHLQSVNALHI